MSLSCFVKQILLLSFFSSLPLFAEENPFQSLSLQALIEEIKHNHTPSRRLAINQLKERLKQYNQTTRQKVLYSLQKEKRTHTLTHQPPHQNGTILHIPHLHTIQQGTMSHSGGKHSL